MKYAIIESGVVANVAESDAPLADNWVPLGSGRRGDLWDGETFTTPKPPEPSIEERRATMRVTRGQFAIAAHVADIITATEAEAWAGGTSLPQAVTDALAAAITDDTERLAARIEALTTTHVRRTAPLLVLLQSALSISDTDADALFG